MKIKEIGNKIEFMFKNFENLERSLNFIESLESKKLAVNERIGLLNKINNLQEYNETLEKKIAAMESNKNLPESKFHRKLKSQGLKSVNTLNDPSSFNYYEGVVENNLSNTREIKKATGLFNIEEYGYVSPNDSDEQ